MCWAPVSIPRIMWGNAHVCVARPCVQMLEMAHMAMDNDVDPLHIAAVCPFSGDQEKVAVDGVFVGRRDSGITCLNIQCARASHIRFRRYLLDLSFMRVRHPTAPHTAPYHLKVPFISVQLCFSLSVGVFSPMLVAFFLDFLFSLIFCAMLGFFTDFSIKEPLWNGMKSIGMFAQQWQWCRSEASVKSVWCS